MDAEKNPAESKANDKSVTLWRLILLVLCAVGVVLLAGILIMQFAEYRFYKAAPNVWPQPGAGSSVGAPVVPEKPAPAPATTTSAAPVVVSSPTPALASTSAPAAIAVSTSAPAAAKP